MVIFKILLVLRITQYLNIIKEFFFPNQCTYLLITKNSVVAASTRYGNIIKKSSVSDMDGVKCTTVIRHEAGTVRRQNMYICLGMLSNHQSPGDGKSY